MRQRGTYHTLYGRGMAIDSAFNDVRRNVERYFLQRCQHSYRFYYLLRWINRVDSDVLFRVQLKKEFSFDCDRIFPTKTDEFWFQVFEMVAWGWIQIVCILI